MNNAKDFVEMQWLMLQQDQPEDFVIATGRQVSVRKFIELAASFLGWNGIKWEGEGENEVGKRRDNGKIVIRIDPKFYRPAEVESLIGSPVYAHKKLGWTPTISLEGLVEEMIKNDKQNAKNELLLKHEKIK